MTMEASKVSQSLIGPQLAMMKQGVSPENKAQLEVERQQILGRLRAARQRAVAKSAILPKDTASGFPADRDQIAPHIQEPAKEKTKTRPDTPSASTSLHAKYAAAFATLAMDDEVDEREEPPPVLYTLKRSSIAYQVIALMSPDRSKGIEEAGKAIVWLDLVSTVHTLGFAAEHRGGFAFTFKGAIRLPNDPLAPQKRSISVHAPSQS